ncbi:unnamed protein product [Heterosigma akashiwo]
MQGDIERTKFTRFVDSAKTVLKEGGPTAFYRGATFRYGRMCIAVGMMDFLQSNIGPMMYPHKFV